MTVDFDDLHRKVGEKAGQKSQGYFDPIALCQEISAQPWAVLRLQASGKVVELPKG